MLPDIGVEAIVSCPADGTDRLARLGNVLKA
jgi:hypothetical protein